MALKGLIIERSKKDAEIYKLRQALEQIIRFAEDNGMQDWKMTKIARKALEK